MIKHVANLTCEHVSRLCELRLCAGSFFDFFPFSRRGLCYFVFSALDIGDYKRFDGNDYRSLRKFFLLLSYVNEHDFESTWLWDVNPLGNSYVLIAFVGLQFQSRQIAQS